MIKLSIFNAGLVLFFSSGSFVECFISFCYTWFSVLFFFLISSYILNFICGNALRSLKFFLPERIIFLFD